MVPAGEDLPTPPGISFSELRAFKAVGEPCGETVEEGGAVARPMIVSCGGRWARWSEAEEMMVDGRADSGRTVRSIATV